MEIILRATDMVTTVDGVPVRLWEGTTGRGIACKVYVARIAVHEAVDATEFESELRTMPPHREVTFGQTLDMRMI